VHHVRQLGKLRLVGKLRQLGVVRVIRVVRRFRFLWLVRLFGKLGNQFREFRDGNRYRLGKLRHGNRHGHWIGLRLRIVGYEPVGLGLRRVQRSSDLRFAVHRRATVGHARHAHGRERMPDVGRSEHVQRRLLLVRRLRLRRFRVPDHLLGGVLTAVIVVYR
jgi:hypothetical protein